MLWIQQPLTRPEILRLHLLRSEIVQRLAQNSTCSDKGRTADDIRPSNREAMAYLQSSPLEGCSTMLPKDDSSPVPTSMGHAL